MNSNYSTRKSGWKSEFKFIGVSLNEVIADMKKDSGDRGEKASILKDLTAKSKEVAEKAPKEHTAPKKSRAEEAL